MPTYIALLRGINVLGASTLPMKELVEILEDLGARAVRTYIQSGNVVLVHGEKNSAKLSTKIAAAVMERRGFTPAVLLWDLKEFEKAIKGNPFPEAETEPRTLHVGFLAEKPVKPDLSAIEALKKESERFRLKDRFFYLHTPEGFGTSKLAGRVEKTLACPVSFRNWRTVCKVWELAREVV